MVRICHRCSGSTVGGTAGLLKETHRTAGKGEKKERKSKRGNSRKKIIIVQSKSIQWEIFIYKVRRRRLFLIIMTTLIINKFCELLATVIHTE